MCYYATIEKNPRYLANKKNGGKPPLMKFKESEYYTRPCHKCKACKEKKKNEWTTRLNEEMRNNPKALSCTMTFTDERLVELEENVNRKTDKQRELYLGTDSYYDGKLTGYNLENELCKAAWDLFKDRFTKKKGKAPRHWAISELGGNRTERIHLHVIF